MSEEVLGVDLGRGRWTVVRASVDDGGRIGDLRAEVVPFDQPIPIGSALAVLDIPIGLLPDDEAARSPKGLSGDREVDKAARTWCAETSSVFAPPTASQQAACLVEHARPREGLPREHANVRPGGLTRQTFELAPAIESARRLKAAHPQQVFEGHPEVTFTMLAGGKVPARKTTLLGQLVRLGLLGVRLERELTSWLLRAERQSGLAADNWLDALAMLVVACDWATGTRAMLRARDGHVRVWDGSLERLLAVPRRGLTKPPPALTFEQLLAAVRPEHAPPSLGKHKHL